MATQPSALSLFPSHVPIADKDGRASAEFYRALNILFGRVGANGVAPGEYGEADTTLTITVDPLGKITSINAVPIEVVLAQISDLSSLTVTLSQISDLASLSVTLSQISNLSSLTILLSQISNLASLIINYTQVTGLGTMATKNVGTNFSGALLGKSMTIVDGIVTSVTP